MTHAESEDIAEIIAGQTRRISRLERERTPDGSINLIRLESDTVEVSESVTATTASATASQWDSDDWDDTFEWS